jgi:phytoene dehydrogenase-like protein
MKEEITMAKRVMIFLIIAAVAVFALSGSLLSSMLTEALTAYHYLLPANDRGGNEKADEDYQVDATTAATRVIPTLEDSEEETYAGDYDVVVIGAGGGGLSAAATMAMGGMKVLVIEQHSKVGGYMTDFTRGDYTFETTLMHFGGFNEHAGTNNHLFETLGIKDRVKPLALETAYIAVYPDATYSVPIDPDEYREYLIEKFPHEEAGIKGFFKTTGCMETAILISKAVLEKKPLEALRAWAKNPLFMMVFMKYSDTTIAEMLDEYFQDEKLKGVISWLSAYTDANLEDMNVMALLGMFSSLHYGGFYHFEGGSQSVTKALADVVEENGGVIKLSTMATKIVIENGKAVGVKTSDGSLYNSKYVVSNANALDTYNKMVGREKLSEEFLANLDSKKPANPLYFIYLGVNKDYTDKFNGTHVMSVSSHYIPPEGYGPQSDDTPETTRYLIANFSAIDSTVAPPGKNVITIHFGLPESYEDGYYEDDSTYIEYKEEVAQAIIKRVETYLPGLSDYIEVMEVATPRTMEHYTLNTNGATGGWYSAGGGEPLAQQSPIENLLLAGHWVSVGSEEMVLRSGLSTGNMILKMEKK